MESLRKQILKNHCYTKLVYERINKKLNVSNTNTESEVLIKKILQETPTKHYVKKGMNFYVSNNSFMVRITINSNTYRVITVDRIKSIL